MHDKKCDNRCQCSYFFFLLCHTNCYAHGKYDRQVRENNVTCSIHNLQNLIQYGSRSHNTKQTVSFQHCFICKRSTNSKQQTGYRQNCDRQHEGSSNPLQNSKNFVFHSSPHSFSIIDIICYSVPIFWIHIAGSFLLSSLFSRATKKGTNPT